MRSLEQLGAQLDKVEAGRTAVNATNTPGNATAVHVINHPGSFYLTTDILISGNENGVLITSSGVTLDLNGHRITADEPGGTGYGVKIAVSTSPAAGIVIRNGSIMDCGGGVYSETSKLVKLEHLQISGVEGYGVYIHGDAIAAAKASDVHVLGATGYGILLDGNSIAESCTVTYLRKSQIGIQAKVARDCAVMNIKNSTGSVVGIMATTAENCTASDVDCTSAAGSMTWGIYGAVVLSCSVENVGLSSPVAVYGIGGTTVENCMVSGIHGLNPYGIYGNSGVVRSCTVASVTALAGSTEGYGIRANEIQHCTVDSLTSASTIQGIRGDKISDCEVGTITGVSPAGIWSTAGVTRCYVRAVTATTGTTNAYGINAPLGTVSECTVNSLHCASGALYGIYAATVRNCRLYSHGFDTGDIGTHYGIATSLAGVAEGNSLQMVRNFGIYLGQGSVARGNAIFNVGNVTGVPDGKAIVGLTGCRIEGNTIGGDAPDYGIFVTGTGCLVVGNQCNGTFGGATTGAGGADTGAYNIVAGNRFGPIITGGGVIATTVEGANFAN